MISSDDYMARAKVERAYEYRKWVDEIPYITFKPEWEVKIIPPFGGAIARFCIKHKENGNYASIYLDCYDELGCFGEPYWEVYPYDGDVYGTEMDNIDDLVRAIDESLNNERRREK